ncbi:MAG: membrane protein insertase YidC [Paramuribaculum sp.]|nr:membrane protein insertase YidC [Paramuribaculum sp.]
MPGYSVSVADILRSSYPAQLTDTQRRDAVNALKTVIANAEREQGFSLHRYGTDSFVTLSNDTLSLRIASKGAMVVDASLLRYQKYDSTLVNPIAPGTDNYGFVLTSATQTFDTRDYYFTPVLEGDSAVLMKLDLGNGAFWGIRYTLHPDSYLFTMDIVQQGMEALLPVSTSEITFLWDQKMARNEEGRMFEERNSTIYYMDTAGDVDNLSEYENDTEEFTQHLRWIAYKNQFFSTVLIPREYFASATLSSEVLKDDPHYLKYLTSESTFDYSPSHANPLSFTWFVGPNYYPMLSELSDTLAPDEDLHLTRLIPLGWSLFRWINTLIVIPVFSFLGGFISNYGIIILLLTIFIKILLFPFTYKSYMSQAKMRVLAPEIKEINDRYPAKEDALKRQQETMALYRKAGANPMSGCLPMLLQMPILIAMFNFFPSAIELRGQSFLWAHDLSAPDIIFHWNADIPIISWILGNHLSLFCLLMTAVNIIYTRINMQNQPSAMPGMKWMMYLMPLMFLFFFNNYAAGLSYYYFLSLLITIIQTYIFRKVVDEEKVRATMKANAAKPRKKSGFMARLEEAQRRQQAMLREQQRQQNKKSRR